MRLRLCLALVALTGCASLPARGAPAPPAVDAIAARTATLQGQAGFLPLYWDDKEGKLFLEIPRPGDELIYQVSLAAGVGSNPIGLDRNQLGDTLLVRFERVGPKVLLVQPSVRFRAIGGSAAEQKAVEQ